MQRLRLFLLRRCRSRRSHLRALRINFDCPRLTGHLTHVSLTRYPIDVAQQPCRSVVVTIGNTGDVDRIGAIVTGQIAPQGMEQVGGVVTFPLLKVDLHAGVKRDV